MKITDLVVTPIAFRDPPLLNSVGAHEPLALRIIFQVHVEGGIVGAGECNANIPLEAIQAVREGIIGMSVTGTKAIEQRVDHILRQAAPALSQSQRLWVFSPIEVACLDALGKILNLPVSDLLGGAVRQRVEFSAYLFYKWEGHTGQEPDRWGPALDPAGIVRQAQQFVSEFGFKTIKLKGGVFPPAEESAAIRALAAALPGYPLRIDPNGAWTIATAKQVVADLHGVIEYFEDPVLTIDGMSQVSAETPIPLATNMCVVETAHIGEAFEKDAVQVVLSDHHIWGGLRRTRELAAICEALGWGVSMHSNSHLGISLAAMIHLAATIPNLDYACDTHYPWNYEDDIIRGGPMVFTEGTLPVPNGPGLGVDIDPDKLAEAHERYIEFGRTTRDDSGYRRTREPHYDPTLPRF
ncbi:MAG: glucarate dehydratase [Candidatus Lumbricidophila eiseniae]|uniref:glucarate dehydratase n=1 Tax=Candidatus Lumbricidiphila eiseniae TaxID=1969409 RepID=A0A2A6FS70_9MICO|nr:MAG: glucarate dehydratase [Candidatus Lumbricidophila eiseniae]